MKVETGHFGDVRLDGVIWAQLIAWPGPIHEGGGEVQPILDDRASRAQVDAVFRILKGEETEPGATIFNIFAATIDKVHKPIFTRIEFEHDLAARRGRFVDSRPGRGGGRADPQSGHRGGTRGAGRPPGRLRISRGRIREQPDPGAECRCAARLAGPPRLPGQGRDDRRGRRPLIRR